MDEDSLRTLRAPTPQVPASAGPRGKIKPKAFTLAVYLLAGAAMACSFWRVPWKDWQGIPYFLFRPLLFTTPATLLLILYLHRVRQPRVGKTGRTLLTVASFAVAEACLVYLVLVTIPGEMTEHSLIVDLLLVLTGPATFALATFLILSRGRSTYALVSLIVFLVWTYLASVITHADFQDLTGAISPLIFAAAIGAAFYRPRWSSIIGAIAGLAAGWWLLAEERGLASWGGSSWITFNWYGTMREEEGLLFWKARILAAALVVIATVISLVRLLPPHWMLRKRPINGRTWPAFLICFMALSAWFLSAASPYRIPYIVDGGAPDLTILHVEKRGLQFHESAVGVYHDLRFSVSRNNRKLFQYQFEECVDIGVISETMRQPVFHVVQSPQLENMHTMPARPLRAWNAEGWYVRTPRSRVLAFTTEYGTTPPAEIVDLFHRLEAVPLTGKSRRYGVKDVCLGFCYDPLAGLGFLFVNQRCHTDENGKTRCR